jgi:hypothetical protein
MHVCLYSCLSYPAFEAHLLYVTLYCHMWCVWLFGTLFFTYIINGRILEKILNPKYVFFLFCTTFVSNIYDSKKDSVKYYHKCAWVFM